MLKNIKLLVFGEINGRNIGDQAIYKSLKSLLEQSNFSVEGFNFTKEKPPLEPHHSIFLSKLEIDELALKNKSHKNSLRSQIINSLGIVSKLLFLLKQRIIYSSRRAEIAKAIKFNDIILFGGGALLSDNNWNFPLNLYFISRNSITQNKPYIVFGCSVGNRFSFFGKKLITKFLDNCDHIVLRDELSGLKLKQLGYPFDNINIDTALFIEDVFKIYGKTEKSSIGINVMSYVNNPAIDKKSYNNYIEELARLIKMLDNCMEIEFDSIILFNTGEVNDTNTSIDIYAKVSKSLSKKKLFVSATVPDIEIMTEILGRFKIIIGTRMHSSILANSYNIPSIGISWDPKVAGYYAMMNCEKYCMEYKNVNAKDIYDLLIEIDRDPPDYSKEKTKYKIEIINSLDLLYKKYNQVISKA